MKNLVIIALLMSFSFSFSQTKGKITYKLTIEKDSLEQPYENEKNTEAQNEALEIMHESQTVNSYLVFNKDISVYYVEEKTDTPNWENTDGVISITPSGINFSWIWAGGDALSYNDFSSDFHISQSKTLGKPIRLVKKKKKWILKDEAKVIDGYKCKLAIIEKLNGKVLKAWYSTEIQVKHGPRDYFGLPGLIVKIEDVILTWTMTSIDFESEEANMIEEPTEGKLVTMEEYRKLAGNPFGK